MLGNAYIFSAGSGSSDPSRDVEATRRRSTAEILTRRRWMVMKSDRRCAACSGSRQERTHQSPDRAEEKAPRLLATLFSPPPRRVGNRHVRRQLRVQDAPQRHRLRGWRSAGFHDLAPEPGRDGRLARPPKARSGRRSTTRTRFAAGPGLFAHNGTVKTSRLAGAHVARAAAEIAGDTDSERLFAWLLTFLDGAGARPGAEPRSTPPLARACHEARVREGFGAFNSSSLIDGSVLYAHRFGRTLYLSSHAALRPSLASPAGPRGFQSRPRRAAPRRPRRLRAHHRRALTPIDDGALIRVVRRPVPACASTHPQALRQGVLSLSWSAWPSNSAC